jgi:hypothetical protein
MPDMMFEDESLLHFDELDDGKGPKQLHQDFYNGARSRIDITHTLITHSITSHLTHSPLLTFADFDDDFDIEADLCAAKGIAAK